ncbi:hypothetical protein BPOR_0554g00050 [Botrytis porri]|uniref:Uncharacterized protein n=1 Tax=Botrytis porri TaxID=87229 RepID=A0A4Z1KQX0_9HELO|nr:hypothetical protein BPOR_0554g00050 [Botrytis porri]
MDTVVLTSKATKPRGPKPRDIFLRLTLDLPADKWCLTFSNYHIVISRYPHYSCVSIKGDKIGERNGNPLGQDRVRCEYGEGNKTEETEALKSGVHSGRCSRRLKFRLTKSGSPPHYSAPTSPHFLEKVNEP